MDPIRAALAPLAADASDTTATSKAKDDADAAAAAAPHAAEVAGADKAAAISQQNADRDAAKPLLEQTYRVAG